MYVVSSFYLWMGVFRVGGRSRFHDFLCEADLRGCNHLHTSEQQRFPLNRNSVRNARQKTLTGLNYKLLFHLIPSDFVFIFRSNKKKKIKLSLSLNVSDDEKSYHVNPGILKRHGPCSVLRSRKRRQSH